MLKSIVLSPNDIQVGYILDEDIYEGSRFLLRKGSVITSRTKKALQHKSKIKVLVEVDDVERYCDKTLHDDRLVVLDEQVRSRIFSSITGLFEDVKSTKTADLASDISQTLVNEVLNKDWVGVNLEALKISDEYTFKHSVDVAAMGITLGKHLGLAKSSLVDLGTAGVLHDIGKIEIPDSILNKNGKLTDEEFNIIKNHPVYGYQLLVTNSSVSETIRRGVLYHHEKYGGGGYPSGLVGENIPLYARILSVVDVFDALITTRPYHNAYSASDALELMYTMSSQFDVKIFKVFLSSLIVYPIGSTVNLSNGQPCQVVKSNDGYPLRPVVRSLITGDTYDLANDSACLSLMIV